MPNKQIPIAVHSTAFRYKQRSTKKTNHPYISSLFRITCKDLDETLNTVWLSPAEDQLNSSTKRYAVASEQVLKPIREL